MTLLTIFLAVLLTVLTIAFSDYPKKLLDIIPGIIVLDAIVSLLIGGGLFWFIMFYFVYYYTLKVPLLPVFLVIHIIIYVFKNKKKAVGEEEDNEIAKYPGES